MRVPEVGGGKFALKIIVENFPNLRKELEIQLHKANRISNYYKAKTLFKTHYVKSDKIQ